MEAAKRISLQAADEAPLSGSSALLHAAKRAGKNFPDVKIVKIEKKTSKYEVELSDDVELTINLLCQFKSMKMDD